jgi:hypothetical protein
VSDADPRGPAQGSTSSVSASLAQEPFNSPVQIWACGVSDHRHLAKADALKCLEKRTVGPTEAKIAIAAVTTPMVEAESVAPAAEACEPAETTRSNSMEREETDGNNMPYVDPDYQPDGKKILDVTETDAQSLAPAMPGMLAIASGVPGVARFAALLQEGKPNMRKLAAGLLAKAKHSQGDQALLDIAFLACDKCLSIGGLSVGEKENMGKARDHLHKAGALSSEGSILDVADDVEGLLPAFVGPPGESLGAQTMKVLGVSASVLGKAGGRIGT